MSDGKREVIHTLVSELCFENGKNSKRVARDFAGTVDKLEKRAAKASSSFNLLNKSIKDTLVGQHFEKAIAKYKELWDTAKGRTTKVASQSQAEANRPKYLPDKLYNALARINKAQVKYGHKMLHKLDRLDYILRKQIAQTNKAYFGKLDTQFIRNFTQRIKEFQEEYGRLPSFVTGEKTSVKQKAGIFEWETPDEKFFREVSMRDLDDAVKPFWRRIVDEFSIPTNIRKLRKEMLRSDHIFGFQFLFANSVIDRLNELNKNVIKLEHPLAKLGFELAESLVHNLARLFPGWATVFAGILTVILEKHRLKQQRQDHVSKISNLALMNNISAPEAEVFYKTNELVLKREYDNEEIINASKQIQGKIKEQLGTNISLLEAFDVLYGTAIKTISNTRNRQSGIDYLTQMGISKESAVRLIDDVKIGQYLLDYGFANKGNVKSEYLRNDTLSTIRNERLESARSDIEKTSKIMPGTVLPELRKYTSDNELMQVFLKHNNLDIADRLFAVLSTNPNNYKDLAQKMGEVANRYSLGMSLAPEKRGFWSSAWEGLKAFDDDSMLYEYDTPQKKIIEENIKRKEQEKIADIFKEITRKDAGEYSWNSINSNFVRGSDLPYETGSKILTTLNDIFSALKDMVRGVEQINNKTPESGSYVQNSSGIG